MIPMDIGIYIQSNAFFRNPLTFRIVMLSLLIAFMANDTLARAAERQIDRIQVNLQIKEATVPEGLAQLEQTSGVTINYSEALFDRQRRLSLDARSMKVTEALRRLLAHTGAKYKIADRHTILLYTPQQPGRVSGKVVDERGEPLAGASITIVELNRGAKSGVDGSFNLPLTEGTYTIEVSYLGFQTKRVTDVRIREGGHTSLDVALQPANAALGEVTITASYGKASIEGLYARQRNAAELSNGISADQIGATPDKNIGESLKRISGVTTFDNRYIVVRGIGERYNAAMLDGTLLPSTEADSRNFSFDLIPTNMVDNVVVSKTVTPDMNGSFGGGLIQINTRDIPDANFLSFTVGVSYNDQTTGKDFLSRKRGQYDYLGFDDGRREFPEGLVVTDGATPEVIEAQSKRFVNDNFSVYTNPAAPSQNYQVALGRVFSLDTLSGNRLGFTASLSYRNTQGINTIEEQTRGSWTSESTNQGKAYGFNTTWGALVNAGLQLGSHRFSLRNTYTHLYNNAFVNTTGWSTDRGPSNSPVPSRIEEADDPTFTDLLQNKLSGQHQFGEVKVEWNVARTSVSRKEKDLGIADKAPREVGTGYRYVYANANQNGFPMSRHNYTNSERHYSWNVSASLPFSLGTVRSTAKLGYFGVNKHGEFDWAIAAFVLNGDAYRPVGELIAPENLSADGYHYEIDPYNMEGYEGKSRNHAGYLMLDQRLAEKLRLVWGLRGEYYNYIEIRNSPSSAITADLYSIKPDPRWQWLPSANLTYSPLATLNLRAAYSSTVVRPELMDNSRFYRYSPSFGSMFGSQGLYSTRIDSYDFRAEWFPGAGEVISAGAFYKWFDKPAEVVVIDQSTHISYNQKSSFWAKVYGLEFELRKNFGFIADNRILQGLTAYGNLTLQNSDVKAYYLVDDPDDPDAPDIEVPVKQNRPMYGQTPYLINAGLQYADDKLGLNLAYNKSSYKTYVVSMDVKRIEYEAPRAQIDAQVSYRFLNKRLEVKLNAGNLLNQASMFYANWGSYEANPDYQAGVDDPSNAQRLKEGFTEKYEEGDRILFKQRFGRTYSTSLTYSF